jgi:aromatic ring hydroxylase
MRQTDTYNVQLDKKQVLTLIRQLDEKDKISVLKELKKSVFLKRFEDLLESLRANDLTFEEITKEVEIVRQKRYAEGKHKI